MNVKQLIKELKKMPQNLEVGVAMHDNSEWEVAGDVTGVMHLIKDELDPIFVDRYEEDAFEDTPDECVVIQCYYHELYVPV